MNFNDKKCSGCLKCIDACDGKSMVEKRIEHKPYFIAKHVAHKCLMCWTTGQCDAEKVCESGCFEIT